MQQTGTNILTLIRNYKPIAIVTALPLLLTKFVQTYVIWRLVRGFLILLGLIALLLWLGFDFVHVADFFANLPYLLNLNDTWVGNVYTLVFQKVGTFIYEMVKNLPPPPSLREILDSLVQLVNRSGK